MFLPRLIKFLSEALVIVMNVAQISMESYSVEQRDFGWKITFSDEAHFWMNWYLSNQNSRIWDDNNAHETHQLQMHPEKVTVWCGLRNGRIIGIGNNFDY